MSDCDVTQMGELMAREQQPEDNEVVESSTSTQQTKVIIPALCQKCWWINRCDYVDNQIDCFLPKEDVQ